MKSYGEYLRIIRLCVDSYDEGVISGRYFHPGAGPDGVVFHSITQFLTSVEKILDELNFPQALTQKRSFADAPSFRTDSYAESSERTGRLATFSIRLIFRQHASWQGTVTWAEKKSECSFRSVLELILLIDSALNSED